MTFDRASSFHGNLRALRVERSEVRIAVVGCNEVVTAGGERRGRECGDANGVELARDFVGGAGDSGQPRPFTDSVAFTSPTTSTGSVQFQAKSLEGDPIAPCGIQTVNIRTVPVRFAPFTG